MPNAIGPTGLTVATQAELVAQFTAAMKAIYGADINLDQDSPDGQMMMLFLQTVLDLQDLLVQIYNMFDPDNAIGVVLDQRVTINGIQRQAGTFTVTNVTITTSQSVNLYGLDQTDQPVYTVADNAGNQYQLQTTQLGVPIGANVLAFQAANPGAVQTLPNTITVPVIIVLGVVTINNPTQATSIGINEENDATLKIRRQKSVSLSSQGYLAGLLAALENITGVTSAFVYENTTDAVNTDGVPGHSIWVIVAGTGTAADIANAIYTKRNSGCGMFGSISFAVTQKDGSQFLVLWDTVIEENLYIQFTASSLNGVNPPNIAGIRVGLQANFKPSVNGQVNINDLATLIQQIDSNTLVTAAGFGLTSTGPFSNTLNPSAKNKQFSISSPNIIILPMILSPYNPFTAIPVVVPHGQTQQFTGLGGFGTLTYSMLSNPSGGSVNSGSGLYTAGATPATDVVKVIDSLGNIATATVTVT